MNQTTGKKPLDLVDTARNMVDAAIAVTTGRMHRSSPADTLALLRQADQRAVREFRRELSRQIASALLLMDARVEAVYEDRAAPGEDAASSVRLTDPIVLWIQVLSRTAALSAAIDALNVALAQAYNVVTPEPPLVLVETIIVDERDSRILRVGDPLLRAEPMLLGRRDQSG